MGELLQSNPLGLPAPSMREPLAKRKKACGFAKGPISEGAGTEGDWGSFC